MSTPSLLALAAELAPDSAEPLRLRKGVCVAVNPIDVNPAPPDRGLTLTVRLGGSTTVFPARTLGPSPVKAGDAVWLLQQGPALLVLGSAFSSPQATRTAPTLDALLPSGTYDVSPATPGSPGANGTPVIGVKPADEWFLVHVLQHTNASPWVRQVAYQMTGVGVGAAGAPGSVWTRAHDGGQTVTDGLTWTPWERLGGADPSWQVVGTAGRPAFENGFTDYGVTTDPSFGRVRYRKLSNGLVVLQGLAGNGAPGSVVFTLPPGYRPAQTAIFATYSGNVAARVDVNNAGQVVLVLGHSATYNSLAGVTFPAEV